MTERQFRQSIANRRRPGAPPPAPIDRVLRDARRSVDRARRAAQALHAALPSDLAGVEFVSLERGRLTVRVPDRLAFERLRRRAPSLRTALLRRIALRRLIVEVAE